MRGSRGPENVGATDDTGSVLATFVVALVEVTELLAAQGGGAAGDAILLEMVASTEGHKASK